MAEYSLHLHRISNWICSLCTRIEILALNTIFGRIITTWTGSSLQTDEMRYSERLQRGGQGVRQPQANPTGQTRSDNEAYRRQRIDIVVTSRFHVIITILRLVECRLEVTVH